MERVYAVLAAVGLLAVGVVWAGEEEDGPARGVRVSAAPSPATETEVSARYTRECGSCHVAYPPRFLPARSWDRLLAGLGDHFGDNAEISPEARGALAPWLRAQAGDTLGLRSVARIPADRTPLRITELDWFRAEHGEVPAGVVGAGRSVASLAACAGCHLGAAAGRFGEGQIRIPGYGAWDD